ncbi:MAG: phosphoribosyl-ATP diphosphatase [Spirochaetales bacterium]|nr:phosphoribosyl-ATP diphosphatase [Spirochaetales bacterium]
MKKNNIFHELFSILEQRKTASPESSYVARLFAEGTGKINEKIAEEAGEVCEAADETGTEHLVYEICDLLFHTFVLAAHKNITLQDIENELSRRYGKSGLEEKASRKK